MFGDYTLLFKVSMQGTLGDGPDEIFSYSRWVVGKPGQEPASIATNFSIDVAAMLIQSSTAGPFTTIGQSFPTNVQWTNCAVWQYDESTGLWDSDVPRFDAPLTDAGSGSGLPGMPFQNAMCVTSRTSGRGRRERNRFYLPPMLVAATDGKSQWLPQLIDDIQASLQLTQESHITTDDAEYCVYSPTDHLAKQVNNWYTGSVVDTIRRRRNQLVETRHVATATP